MMTKEKASLISEEMKSDALMREWIRLNLTRDSFIGCGAGRVVFQCPGDQSKVVKLGYNEVGVIQNLAEFEVWEGVCKVDSDKEYFLEVFGIYESDDCSILIQEKGFGISDELRSTGIEDYFYDTDEGKYELFNRLMSDYNLGSDILAPDNLMVSKNNKYVIADYGFLKNSELEDILQNLQVYSSHISDRSRYSIIDTFKCYLLPFDSLLEIESLKEIVLEASAIFSFFRNIHSDLHIFFNSFDVDAEDFEGGATDEDVEKVEMLIKIVERFMLKDECDGCFDVSVFEDLLLELNGLVDEMICY